MKRRIGMGAARASSTPKALADLVTSISEATSMLEMGSKIVLARPAASVRIR